MYCQALKQKTENACLRATVNIIEHQRFCDFGKVIQRSRLGWLVGWGLTALLTQNRSYRACKFVGIFHSKLWSRLNSVTFGFLVFGWPSFQQLLQV